MSTTIWSEFEPLAQKEGSALLFSDDTLTIASDPEEKIETDRWEDLYACQDAFYIGAVDYEGKSLFYKPRDVKQCKRPPLPLLGLPSYTHLSSTDTKTSYLEKIATVKTLIAEGEAYQVNLTQGFTLETSQSSFDLFMQLYRQNPARYAAYINCGSYAILSFSPELFLKKRGENISTSPIKGTAPRGETAAADRENRARLLSSEKERAELLMITDLMRNDLSQVCHRVEVKELFSCTSHPAIFHLHSTIAGVLKPAHPIDQIRPLFPAGSITGCPKPRAMEVIKRLEGRRRGVYTGIIGAFKPNGDFTFNVAIRTLVYRNGMIDAQFGGAITYDSDPEKEWEEVFHKAASLFPREFAKSTPLCDSCCRRRDPSFSR
ncbi:MAG: Isochorismate synthase MenF [Chlamydiales bacterium]|nr:Isochorismate synthase MenF [Chlamydiales bacterium]MCH9619344.1 Isochorismate synthase MenF [Chlamydiales bacterium]MCH9622148.1 Isochorismate synthase MenF [Chlamydiales bacterium]